MWTTIVSGMSGHQSQQFGVEVLRTGNLPTSWSDPRVPDEARYLWSQLQSVEADARRLARSLGLGFGPGDEHRVTAFTAGMEPEQRAFVEGAAAPHGPQERLLAHVYRHLLSGRVQGLAHSGC